MPKRKVKEEVQFEESDLSSPPEDLLNGVNGTKKAAKKTSLKRKVKVEEGAEDETAPTPKRGKKRKVKVEEEEDTAEVQENGEVAEKKPKVRKKRKTKEEKEAEAMPLAARTIGHKLFIGAHVSSAGGVHNSAVNSTHIGGNAFALFLKSQRKWANPPLIEEHCTSFHANCSSHSYDQGQYVVPHGSYLVNLAHTDEARTEQAYDAFLDDLQRCERLGIKLYNFHPGVANSTGGDRGAAIAHLASNINRAHNATSSVVTLLENMAAGGNVLGSTFEDLRDTIALVQNKDRVGMCLDTCHAFAAGYDLRSPDAFQATMTSFEDIVGIKYLRAVHMNDSKAPFASHRDLHQNIGTGFLGLRAFHNIVNDARFAGIPLILETPLDAKDADGVPIKDEKGKEKEDKGNWAREIKLLESLVGMDVEGEEFAGLERMLARKGKAEREKMMEGMERRAAKVKEKEEKAAAKAAKAGEKGKGKGKKAKEAVEEEESSEGDESPLTDLEDESDVEGGGDTQRFAE